MVTYGFYNSINHDRVYDATQMSEIFDGIIRDGVYQYVGNKFLVDKNGLEGFQIRVGTGRAWFNHTWTKNDAPLILTLPAPPTLDNYYRADAIVIDINANVNVRENKITYVTGTEVANNSSPPYPELLDGEHKQVPLAYIVRRGAETEINAANINYVVGSSPCPYVTAPVQAVDLSAHVAQWQAAWEQWFQGPNGYVQTQARAFEAEIAAAEAIIENATDDIDEDVAEFRVWIASQKSQFNGWMDDSKENFDSWFANLQYILDGDVAGHLQLEIEELQNRVTPIKNGGTGNDHGHIQSGFKKYSNNRAEIDITNPGLFATSEGMNTTAAGEASHAEGGGNYSYQYQDAHLEGEILWPADQRNEYYKDQYWQAVRIACSGITGKAGGQQLYKLDMPGTSEQNVTGNGSFTNLQATAWAIFTDYPIEKQYVIGGEINYASSQFTINVDLGTVKITWSGAVSNNTLHGAYSYTYAVYGNNTSGMGKYYLVFFGTGYSNDVKFKMDRHMSLPYLADTNIDDDDMGSVQALYLAIILTNDTTNEILKKEIMCIGGASINDSNYAGHYGEIFDKDYYNGYYSFGSTDFIDYALSSYDYSDPDETIYYNGNDNPTLYWYKDDNISIKGRIGASIRQGLNGKPLASCDAYISCQNDMYDDSNSGGLITVKAGSTDTYSFNIYYSLAREYDGLLDGYTYKLVPHNDISVDINSSSPYSIDVNIGSIDRYIGSIMLLKNGLPIRSYNVPSRINFKTWGGSSNPKLYLAEDNNTYFYLDLSYSSDRTDISEVYDGYLLNETLKLYYNIPSGSTDTYTFVISKNTITNGEIMKDGHGFSYPIAWIPAGEHLTINGKGCIAYGKYSHAEGFSTYAKGDYSHAEGNGDSTIIDINDGPGAFGNSSHVEGVKTITTNIATGGHAEGRESIAANSAAHAEGYQTEANGIGSHSEGSSSIADGHSSHAEGYHTIAKGDSSHSSGQYVTAYDTGQFVHGFIPDPRNNLISENQRLLQTAIFGIGGKPRWILSNTSEIAPTTIDALNDIVNKNRNGFSVLLKCGTSSNSIYYKTLLPNDTFATYLEFIEVVAGIPIKQYIASSGRILQLQPPGTNNNGALIERSILFDNHPSSSASTLTAMPVASGSDIYIDGTNYKHVIMNLHNANPDMVSDNARDVYIKYTLIRLV